MSPNYEPEFAKEFAPLAAQMAQAPVPRSGDVEGYANASRGFYQAIVAQLPDYPTITHKIHHCTTKDNYMISIYHFFRIDCMEKPARKTSAILFYHGGGFISGSPLAQRKLIEGRVESTGVPFFAVDYRVAPQQQHLTPLEDSYAALTWLYRNADEFNIDTKRIGVYGESAGGGLAAGVAIMARDNNIFPPLAKQILVYPMIDDRNINTSSLEPLFIWSHDHNRTAWKALLGPQSGSDSVSHYAAPARAVNLSGLPSTYIDVGSLDIFVHEDFEYARKLCKEGVEVELHIWPSLPHCFEGLAPNTRYARIAIANRERAVKSL